MSKPKPILFSAPVIRAILSGNKTQTRRIVKPQPDENGLTNWFSRKPNLDFVESERGWYGDTPDGESRKWLPRWLPDDILWVRETWAYTRNTNQMPDWPGRPHTPTGDDDTVVIYGADGHWQWLDDDGTMTDRSHWKPSIHMPYTACRVWLRVTGVRVERLQDISENDAIAEGVEMTNELSRAIGPVESYRSLWEFINGPDSWEENPVVWVVEFERIEKP